MGTHDWRVEKFCVIFRGQKLGDLWCRPVQYRGGVHFIILIADLPEIWNSCRSVEGRLFCYSCI